MSVSGQKVRPRVLEGYLLNIRPQNPEGLWCEERRVLWAGSARFKVAALTNSLEVGNSLALEWIVPHDARYQAVAEIEKLDENRVTLCFMGTGFRFQARDNFRVDLQHKPINVRLTRGAGDNLKTEKAKILNLSAGGCLLQGPFKPRVGEVYKMSMELEEDDLYENLALRIIRLPEVNQQGSTMACQFVSLRAADETRLIRWLFARGRQKASVLED